MYLCFLREGNAEPDSDEDFEFDEEEEEDDEVDSEEEGEEDDEDEDVRKFPLHYYPISQAVFCERRTCWVLLLSYPAKSKSW